MTLRSCEIFIAVCEQMNMSAAANKLFISQSAVSQSIGELENHYDAKLFERYSGKLYLTEVGKTLLAYARQLLAYHAEIERNMRRVKELPPLRVGATLTAGPYYLLERLAQYYRQDGTQARVVTSIHNTAVLESQLLAAQQDIAVVEGHISSMDIACVPLARDDMVFICNKNSRLHPALADERPRLPVSELTGLPFVVREEGSGSRTQFLEVVRRFSLDVDIVGVFNSLDGIKQAVEFDLGLSVISRRALKPIDQIKEFRVGEIEMTRQFNLVYHKKKHIDASLQAFMDFLRRNA